MPIAIYPCDTEMAAPITNDMVGAIGEYPTVGSALSMAQDGLVAGSETMSPIWARIGMGGERPQAFFTMEPRSTASRAR